MTILASGSPAHRIRSHQVRIPTLDGPNGYELAGTVDMPADVGDNITELPSAVVAHCFTCTRNAPGASRISKALARCGFVSLRFDFAGLGQSGGDFQDTTLAGNVRDVVAASQWLSARAASPSLLVGHSFGGVAVERAAAQVESVTRVAAVCSPYDPAGTADRLPGIVRAFHDDLQVGQLLLEELGAARAADTAQALLYSDAHLLLIHSPSDRVVPFSEAQALSHAIEAARPAGDEERVTLVSMPEIDHLLTNRNVGQEVGVLIARWATGDKG